MVGFEPTVWFPSQVNSLVLSASERHANFAGMRGIEPLVQAFDAKLYAVWNLNRFTVLQRVTTTPHPHLLMSRPNFLPYCGTKRTIGIVPSYSSWDCGPDEFPMRHCLSLTFLRPICCGILAVFPQDTCLTTLSPPFERIVRIELTSPAWKAGVIAIIRHPLQ